MREIKFRAWLEETKEMIPVYNIDFQKGIINTDSAWRWINEVELMQYTGLKDKNGKEIYEGDIVKAEHENYYNEEFELEPDYKPYLGVVAFTEGCYSIQQKGDEAYCPYLTNVRITSIEVIGNIYENPDLLGG